MTDRPHSTALLSIREVTLDSCPPLPLRRRYGMLDGLSQGWQSGRRRSPSLHSISLPLLLLPVSIHSFRAAPRRRPRSFGVFLNASMTLNLKCGGRKEGRNRAEGGEESSCGCKIRLLLGPSSVVRGIRGSGSRPRPWSRSSPPRRESNFNVTAAGRRLQPPRNFPSIPVTSNRLRRSNKIMKCVAEITRRYRSSSFIWAT